MTLSGSAPVDIDTVVPKGGDFHRLPSVHHAHDSERRADRYRAGKHPLHLLGPRICSHVIIMRRGAAQAIAHTAARIERGVAGALQALDDGAGQAFGHPLP